MQLSRFESGWGRYKERAMRNHYPIGQKILHDLGSYAPIINKAEMAKITQQSYKEVLQESLNDGYRKTRGDFFVEMHFKRDALFFKLFKIIPRLRLRCPVPMYGRALFHYKRKEDRVEMLWHIPQKFFFDHPELLHIGEEGNQELLENMAAFRRGDFFKIYESFISKENA
jgi:hypothetical protein